MKNAHIIAVSVILTLLSVSVLMGAYFLGEAHIAFLIQTVRFAEGFYVPELSQ